MFISLKRKASDTACAVEGVSRRGAVARLAAASLGGAAGTGLVAPALAATLVDDTSLVRGFRGEYAISDGRIINGYFAVRRGFHRSDIVVLIHGESGYSAQDERTARRFALLGNRVFAPDLAATYADAPWIGREAMIADLKRRPFHRHPMGTGVVNFVSLS